MSTELIAISGLGVTIISVGVALAALIVNGQNSLRREMQKQREETQAEFKSMREETQAEFKSMRGETLAEFKSLRERIGELRERMARLEGLLEGLREARVPAGVWPKTRDYTIRANLSVVPAPLPQGESGDNT